ncbi:MAG: DUF2127 domain-containing protein [Pseudonocardiales bacterium]|nr:MAG: DUF2127 domain-containing protein [Pseudonocardiales bacterium]
MTAPGVGPGRRRRSLRYELLGCALEGHALVGLDVASLRADDDHLIRDAGDHRWHRCLRCDAWLFAPLPDRPAREHRPPDTEIALPLRGRPLRDRYVLRLIAIDRLIHVVLFVTAAIVILVFAAHRDVLQKDFTRIVADIQGGGHAARGGLLGEIDKTFTFSYRSLHVLALIALGYAVLEGVEAVGLWYAKRWAEYLTFLATIVLLPVEIYELSHRVSALKIITLVINLAVAVYLLLAKRLFGLRGGGRAENREREHDRGWEPIYRATPPRGSAPTSQAGP